MKDQSVDLCGQSAHMDLDACPPLAKEDTFTFCCAGCGDCCRGREDIVLSAYDLWRICHYLRLPPALVIRSFCRHYIGADSHLPVVRLQPLKGEKSSCPFLHQSRCAIHEAKPLVCALYPLGQAIDPDGTVSYYLQPTDCGGQRFAAKVTDYLDTYRLQQREPLDVLWAQTCMALSDRMAALEAAGDPIAVKLAQRRIYKLLYLDWDYTAEFAPQFAAARTELFAAVERIAAGGYR